MSSLLPHEAGTHGTTRPAGSGVPAIEGQPGTGYDLERPFAVRAKGRHLALVVRSPRRAIVSELVMVALALAVVAAIGLFLVLDGPALGWDEAVYATWTRSLVTDIPRSTWALYRPPGVPLLGAVVAPLGLTDVTLRTVTLVLSTATLASVWALGRLVGGRATAFVALLGAMSLPVVIAELPMFHNDLASAGLLMALMALLWFELEVRDAPGRGLLGAGLLAAATFYVRFGALAALVGIAIATALLWAPKLRRHWRLVLASIGIAGALAAPHIATAIRETGSPIGILTMSVDQVDTASPAASLRAYLGWLPGTIAGPVGVVYLLAGAGLIVALVVRRLRRQDCRALGRPVAWLTVPAVVAASAMVLVSHAESRYVLFPALLGVLLGAMALVRAARRIVDAPRRRTDPIRRVPPLLGYAVLVLVVLVVMARNATAEKRDWSERGAWIADAGRWIRDHSDRPCLVATTLVPTMSWYSECVAGTMLPEPRPAYTSDPPPGATFIVFTSIDDRRKSPETLQRYRELVSGDPVATFRGDAGAVEVYRSSP